MERNMRTRKDMPPKKTAQEVKKAARRANLETPDSPMRICMAQTTMADRAKPKTASSI